MKDRPMQFLASDEYKIALLCKQGCARDVKIGFQLQIVPLKGRDSIGSIHEHRRVLSRRGVHAKHSLWWPQRHR